MARNKHPEVTEERILDVAQQLFLEKGYENTTIQDIVDELGGLTKGRCTTTSSPKRKSWMRWATGCSWKTTPSRPSRAAPT